MLIGLLIALGGWSLSRTFELSTIQAVHEDKVDKLERYVEKLRDPEFGAERWPEHQRLPFQKQDNINREHMDTTELQPQYKTFSLGLDFIERNVEADRWYLQIETFDPHEPFFTHKEFNLSIISIFHNISFRHLHFIFSCPDGNIHQN